jgi:Flp pilus assembly protein TadD
MAAVMCAVARVVQTAEGGVGAAWWLRPVVAIDTIGFYATKVVAPVRLAMDYERTPGWVISHWSTAWWLMGVGLMVLVGIWRRRGWVAAGVAMAVVGLLPVLGVVPFDFQAISTVGDRYMYLPMAGVALAAAAVLVRFEGKVAWGVAVVILGVLGGRSFEQAGVWRDTRTLTANQFSFDAGSATGHKVLATWLLEQDQLVEAEEHLRRAIEAFKGSTQQPDGTVWLEYANVLWREGRSAEAIGVFREGIGYQAADKRAAAHDSLGLELMREGKMEEARGEFEEALRLEPGDGVARRNLEGVPLR